MVDHRRIFWGLFVGSSQRILANGFSTNGNGHYFYPDYVDLGGHHVQIRRPPNNYGTEMAFFVYRYFHDCRMVLYRRILELGPAGNAMVSQHGPIPFSGRVVNFGFGIGLDSIRDLAIQRQCRLRHSACLGAWLANRETPEHRTCLQ